MCRTLLGVAFLVVTVLSQGEKDLIQNLPGLLFKANFKSYSGYVDANANGTWKMHYMWVLYSRQIWKSKVLFSSEPLVNVFFSNSLVLKISQNSSFLLSYSFLDLLWKVYSLLECTFFLWNFAVYTMIEDHSILGTHWTSKRISHQNFKSSLEMSFLNWIIINSFCCHYFFCLI